jgi:hypothetical protein
MGNYCNKCIYTIPIIFKTRFVDKNLLGCCIYCQYRLILGAMATYLVIISKR